MESKKTIGNYIIHLNNQLGQGASGIVYQGSHIVTKQMVAIKRLRKKQVTRDEFSKKALYSQIQILKSLKGDNIVRCLDVMESSNNYYIVQEYCNEGQLRKLMNQKQKIPQLQAIDILGQICNGFACMLSEGVIHRDLKPENILLSNGVYKICDFGVSKRLSNKRMKNSTYVGTPLYMSLEILKSAGYTSKCDIWALGCIFYEMLHGKTPWKANSQYELVKNIETKPFDIDDNLSPLTKQLIKSMLQIQQKDRIDWDNLLKHPIFKGKFILHFVNQDKLQNKMKYLMSQLRYNIKCHNINLQKLFDQLGYDVDTQLNFKQFGEFLKIIDADLTHEQQVFMFTKLDLDDSNTISLKQLQTQMIKHHISLNSKFQQIKKMQSYQIDQQQLAQKTNENKLVKAFTKLSTKMTNNNLTLLKIFKAYDVSSDKSLAIQQFGRILKILDDSFSEQQIQYAFCLVDYDENGTIQFDQFQSYFNKCLGKPPNSIQTKS